MCSWLSYYFVHQGEPLETRCCRTELVADLRSPGLRSALLPAGSGLLRSHRDRSILLSPDGLPQQPSSDSRTTLPRPLRIAQREGRQAARDSERDAPRPLDVAIRMGEVEMCRWWKGRGRGEIASASCHRRADFLRSQAFIWLMRICIGQYVIIRPLSTAVAIASEYLGYYCLASWGVGFTHLWTALAITISVTVAMYAVVSQPPILAVERVAD